MSRRRKVRWPNDQLEQLDTQIVTALQESSPQSVRHVFYLMTNPRLERPTEKDALGYRRVQRRLVELRRRQRVPYWWIVDMTRRGHHTLTYDGPASLIRAHAQNYRIDPWAETDRYVEVWTESRSIAGVLEATCREYAVSLYPSGGFASLSLVYSAAEYASHRARGRPVEIVYVGDYDPAGVLIDDAIVDELRAHLPSEITLHRIAITQEQIAKYDLPTKPRKEGEPRRRDIAETVEAEAMPVGLLLDLLRQQLHVFLPDGVLQQAKGIELRIREDLVQLADLINEGEDGLSDVIKNHRLVKSLQGQETEPDDEDED